MDVRCSRCQTEYQLDDAFIGERGTTVSCTRCGFQFRVQRIDGVTTPTQADPTIVSATSMRSPSSTNAVAHADTVELYADPSPMAAASETRRESGLDRSRLGSGGRDPAVSMTVPPDPYLALPFGGGVAARYGGFQDNVMDVESMPPSHRHVGSRWIVALVVLGGLGLLAGTVGRQYFARFVTHEAIESRDPNRVLAMVHKGEQLFYDDDLEGAKAEFDKATVLAENAPVVLSFLARIEAERADMIWLRLRLSTSKAQIVQLRQAFDARLKKLDTAVATALAVAKDDTAVLRTEVDAFRLHGKLSEARALAPRLSGATDDPETDYVLGALDLADESPSWLSVVERLRPAAAIEHGFGRARAALTYSLINAERFADAKAELEKVKPEANELALFAAVESYLDEKGGDQQAPPAIPVAANVEPPVPADTTNGNPAASDSAKRLNEQAAHARAKGDFEAATKLYQQAVDRNPSDVDALTNLGELANQLRDFTGAMQYFERVQQINPNYLPALTGIADIRWINGQKDQAIGLYQRVVDSAGKSSSYGAHAQIRLDEYAKSHATGSEAPVQATPTTAPASSAAEPGDAPVIDTTDLPELQR